MSKNHRPKRQVYDGRLRDPGWERIKPPAMTKEQARALVEEAMSKKPNEGNRLPVTGYCHQCNRKISGERKFCGPCLATHHV